MWILLIIFLAGNGQGSAHRICINDNETRICEFQTEHDCLSWRDYIAFEMADAYPYERNFIIACRRK